MTGTVLITGANRGIGLEFTKQYLEAGWLVYAGCRNKEKATELKKLAKSYESLQILTLDLAKESDIIHLKDYLKNIPIDLIINNAGVLNEQDNELEAVNQKDLLYSFSVNAIAPLLIAQTLLPNLKLGNQKKIVALSSTLGSIIENHNGIWNHYAYKASKAALNMLMSSLSVDPALSEITFLLLSPGWVKTDMGGKNAVLDVEESVKGMREVIQRRRKGAKIAFLDYQGDSLPW